MYFLLNLKVYMNNVSNFANTLNPNIHKTTKYAEIKNSIKFTYIKPNMDKPFPNVGISDMSWSYDSNFLATKNGKLII